MRTRLVPVTVLPGQINRTALLNYIAAGLSLGWLVLLWSTLSFGVDDFKQYWQSGLSVRQTGDPYTVTVAGTQGYYYPPPFAYAMQPFGRLTHGVAQQIWFGINVALLALLIWLCLSVSGSERARRYWGVLLFGVVVAPPTRLSLQLGQITILIAVLLVGSYALARRSPVLSGCLLALASIIKVFPAMLGLLPLVRRQGRVVLWSVVAGLGVVVISLASYGVGPWVSYITRSLTSGDYPVTAEHNISLLGFWRRMLTASSYAAPIADLPVLATLLIALSAIAVLGCVAYAGWKAENPLHAQLQYGVWLCGMLLLSPSNGYYSLVLLLLPVLTILRCLEVQPDRQVQTRLILATALVCIPPGWSMWLPDLNLALHTRWGLFALTPSFYGLLGLLILLAPLARNSRQRV